MQVGQETLHWREPAIGRAQSRSVPYPPSRHLPGAPKGRPHICALSAGHAVNDLLTFRGPLPPLAKPSGKPVKYTAEWLELHSPDIHSASQAPRL